MDKKEKVDLKRIQVLNASYQEKVQPSVDELDYNSEDYMSEESAGAKIGNTLTLPLPSSKITFSQPFKRETYEWCSENW